MEIAVNAKFLTHKIMTQRPAHEISKCLKKINSDIRFISPKNIANIELAKFLNPEKYGGLNSQQIDLPMYLKKTGSPLLINLTGAAPIFYKNQIVSIPDISVLEHPEWFAKKYYYYNKFLIPLIAKNSLKILTLTNFSKERIISVLEIPSSKIEVVNNAVSIAETLVNSENIYGKYILAVSSLDPRKNLKRLISAYNKLKLEDIKLVIVGAKLDIFSDKDNIYNSDNKNIIFAGYVDDLELVNLYKNAFVFVYPTFYEGFGLPPLEAMAYGCPVIASNIPPLSTEVCKDAAYLIDPYNTDDIANGINTLINDSNLRENLIKKGLTQNQLFSWDKSAQKVLDIVKKL